MSIRRVVLIFDNKLRPDTTGMYCRRALEEMVEVEHYLPSEFERIPRHGVDLYLNIDDGLEYCLPPDLRPSAFWAIDTHLQLPWYLTKAPDFDWVFAAQRDAIEHLHRAGSNSVAWLPLACDPAIHRKYDLAKQYDVCFVGNLFHGPRADLVAAIATKFPNTFVGQKFFDEMAQT